MIATSPASVSLIALPVRLRRTWVSFCLSPWAVGMSGRTSTLKSSFFFVAKSAPAGRDFDPQFRPDLTPKQMLELGVFCSKYLTDRRDEFPASWFARAKLSPSGRDCRCNYYFGVDASQRLSEWRRKGWIHPNDPRGWFQWYCRYYLGRRLPEEDARQIGRWKAMRRHVSQIRKHCERGRPDLPAAPASGVVTLGLRQP